MTEILYVCDLDVPTCDRIYCTANGGPCTHTTDESHARYSEPRVFMERDWGSRTVLVETIRRDSMDKNCDTCAHKSAESVDENGNRIVDCDENEFQMYSPYADECRHWEKKSDEE